MFDVYCWRLKLSRLPSARGQRGHCSSLEELVRQSAELWWRSLYGARRLPNILFKEDTTLGIFPWDLVGLPGVSLNVNLLVTSMSAYLGS